MRLKPPQRPAKAVTNHINWINEMRIDSLAYLCLTLAFATPMPSIADNLVELRPDGSVYAKLGKNLHGSMRKLSWCEFGRASWMARHDG